MKKIYTLILVFVVCGLAAQCPWSFTVFSNSSTFSITCSTPTVQLRSVHNMPATLQYSWSGPALNSTLATINATTAGSYSLTITDTVTPCSSNTVITVGVNTVAPTSSVNPLTNTVNCNTSASFTATAISPTTNILHKWYTPITPYPGGPGSYTSNTANGILNTFAGPGMYTHQLIDLTNGCSVTQTVEVTTLAAYPEFSLASPSNYSIGCAPLNQTTISIINPVSTQTPPSIVSYTYLAPGFNGTLGNGPYEANTSTLVTIPGAWVAVVCDNSNQCSRMVEVLITQNTVAPNVAASLITNTLSCKNPTLYAVGTSSTVNTVLSWNVPSTPPLLSTATVIIGPWTGPPTNSALTSYANYTVVASNTVNACQSIQTVPVFQNFVPPTLSLSLAAPTTSVSCDASLGLNYTPASASVTVSSGTLSGNQINNLCYGTVTVCVTNTLNGCKTCAEQIIDSPQGISENAADFLFSLFPNPASSEVHIIMNGRSDGTLVISDLQGREILTRDISLSGEINIPAPAVGVYFVELKSGGKVTRKKLVVLND